jgi:hypothetical protein
MLDLSRAIRYHRGQILAAVDLGLSNSKLKGLNSQIRVINHRGYGHHDAAVIAIIYLRANHDIARRAGRSGGLCRLVKLLDAGGQLEVALGQPALSVAGQRQGDLVPADVDVEVVAGRLGRCGDLVDEGHRLDEVGAREGLDELVAAPLPTGQVLQALGDRGVVQPWHDSSSLRATAIVRDPRYR